MEDLSSGLGDRGRYPTMFTKFRYNLLCLLLLTLLVCAGFAVWQHRVELEHQRKERVNAAVKTLSSFHTVDIGLDPVAMVRLVNQFRALGQDDCVTALQNFYDSSRGRDKKIQALVPLLFEPGNESQKYPTPDYKGTQAGFALTLDNWKGLPVEMVDGIPFGVDYRLGFHRGGTKHPQSFLIAWADQRATINSELIQPSNRPFDAADLVIKKIIERETEKAHIARYTNHVTIEVREQVYTMLEDVLLPDAARLQDIESSDQIWRSSKLKCQNSGLRWDSVAQEYRLSIKN